MHLPIDHEWWFRFQFVYLENSFFSRFFPFFCLVSEFLSCFCISVLFLNFCLISRLWQKHSVTNLIVRLSFMFFFQFGRNGKCKRGIWDHFFFQVLLCIRFPFTDQVSVLILDLFSFIVREKEREEKESGLVSHHHFWQEGKTRVEKERREQRKKDKSGERKTRR